MSHSIPDARAVALHTELGHGPDHRRLQVRPDPGRRQPGRRLAARRARRARACSASAATRPTPTGPGVAPSESSVGPALLESLRALRGPDHRHLLRLQRPPRPAGDRRRRRSSTAGSRWSAARCARTSTSPPTSGSPTRPTGCCISAEGDRGLPRREGGRDLDRQPGRAALGAAPDGPQRPPRRRAALRRHGDLLGDADPRQRALGERDDRPDLRDRRPVVTAADAPIHASGHGWQEELKLMLNLTKPQYVLPVPRRPQAPPPARRARRVGRHRPRTASSQGRNGLPLEIDETGAALRRGRPRRHDLRRRRRHRRARRRRPARPPRRSPPTASSSSSRRSPPTTAPRSPTRRSSSAASRSSRRPTACVEELRDVVEDSLDDAGRGGDPRGAPAPAGPPRRHRRVRLRAAQAAARWSCRSSSRSDGWRLRVTGRGRGAGLPRPPTRRSSTPRARLVRIRARGRASACDEIRRELELGFSELGRDRAGRLRLRLSPRRRRATPEYRAGARDGPRDRGGRLRGDHRGRARADGGREPRRAGRRCALGRAQHRAAPRAGAQPLRRPRHRVPLLLHRAS